MTSNFHGLIIAFDLNNLKSLNNLEKYIQILHYMN